MIATREVTLIDQVASRNTIIALVRDPADAGLAQEVLSARLVREWQDPAFAQQLQP